MLKLPKLFAGRPALAAGRRLYLEAVAQARTPALYRALAAPDTADGRFELYSLHVILLLHRLKAEGEAGAEVAQALFEAYVKSLDDAMREAGVGDLSVGKKVRRLGEAFYGRVKAYDGALAALPDRSGLEETLGRIVFGSDAQAGRGLADYAAAAAVRLAVEPLETFLDGRAIWPEIVE